MAQLARELEQPPITLPVAPHPGKLGRSGSLGQLEPESLHVLALKPAADSKGLILRVQETAGHDTQPKFKLGGKNVRLPRVPANRIMTFRLTKSSGGWKAKVTNATELSAGASRRK